MIWLRMIQHLLPKARALDISDEKQLREFFEGLADSMPDHKEFFDLIWLDIFPQTTRELDMWETQFNLPDVGLTEQERRDRLELRWQTVGNLSPSFIESVLQAAGYNVYVHESFTGDHDDIPPTIRDPRTYLRSANDQESVTNLGETDAYAGEARMYAGDYDVPVKPGYQIVNKLSLTTDNRGSNVPVPSNPLSWPFFIYIGDQTFPDVADINEGDREAFETLVRQIVPPHLWIGMLIDYI